MRPESAGPIKGQGDNKQRTGIVVPVLVSGNFSEPQFKPVSDFEDGIIILYKVQF